VDVFAPWVALLLGYGPAAALRCARKVSDAAEASVAGVVAPLPPQPRLPLRGPLVVGYLSADYNGFSPVGQVYLSRGLLFPFGLLTDC
jgi:hypothetical protein